MIFITTSILAIITKFFLILYRNKNVIMQQTINLIVSVTNTVFIFFLILFNYKNYLFYISVISFNDLLFGWVFYYFFSVVQGIYRMLNIEIFNLKLNKKTFSLLNISEWILWALVFCGLKNNYYEYDLLILIVITLLFFISQVLIYYNCIKKQITLIIEDLIFFVFILMFFIATYNLLSTLLFIILTQVMILILRRGYKK